MPRITGIRPAARRAGWREVRLDGDPGLLLPDEEIVGLDLFEGRELSAAEAERLGLRAAAAEARRIALRYLSTRTRSRREVELRLRRAGIDPETIERTADRLVELDLLDDRDFAAAFTRDRIRLKPCGVRRLRSELGSRGVSPDDAEAGIRETFAEEGTDEAELLERAATSRARRLGRAGPDAARRRLFGFLVRRGFDAAAARAWVEARWPPGGPAGHDAGHDARRGR